jgi:hypothetical protein
MATVNLGSIKFKWKGTYNGATAYTVDDVVSYNGSSYICILASTGNLPTNATYFEQMSSAGTNGTNGTDLTSTLTTQGDLVYRDGSGLQRLGAGTAGQVLQTGGAGANPSWASVSSDYVKLSSTTPSPANTFSIDGFFTSDYDIYKIYVIGISGSAMSSTRLSLRVNVGGSQQTGANYYHHASIFTGTSVNGNWSNGSTSTDSDLGYVHSSSGSTAQAHTELTIFRPLASDKTSILQDTISADGGATWGRYSGFTVWNVATPISGITIGAGDFGSGNIEADRILVYGLKV